MLTIVAMLGFAGVVLADTGTNSGTKLAPLSHDVTAKKAMTAATGDSEGAPVVPTPGTHSGGTPLAPPANDDCSGAIVIPSGSLPVVTAPVDITDATPQGSDDPDVCPANGVDQTVWFSFTPTVSGQYLFSSCNLTATGSNVYDTVVGVFDACSGGTTLKCDDSSACAGPIAGAPYVDQGTAAAVLTAGTTYYIAVGHWSGDVGGVGPGFNSVAVSVELSPAPSNDTCSSPTPLALDRIVFGTTASATNDYRSTPSSCFSGPGQLPTTSNGLDVVFSFLPPDTASYSFRYVQDDASAALRGQSPALYLADNCPAPDPTGAAPPHCIAAANRMNDQTTGNGNRSEEINCVALTAGTPYYLFFDDRFTANPGGPLAVEVTKCHAETEPNNDTATATAWNPNSGCFMEGGAIASGPAADIDFYALGAPPAGSKIFAGVDSAASTTSDYEMRITTATDTLGYDDNDGTSWIGSNAPVVTGPIAPGGEIYARINGKTVNTGMQPYLLFAKIEAGPAEPESTSPYPDVATAALPISNGSTYGATHLLGGGYVSGIMASLTDQDCFAFVAHEGDNLVAFSDNNPSRTGNATNVWPVLRTINGNPTPANTRFVGQVWRNNLAASPGTLTGTTPSVVSEFMHYRARYTGMYWICYTPTQDINSADLPPASAYPLAYGGSLSLNCGPIPAPGSADVSVTKTGPAGPVRTGDIVDYTITVTNNDANGVAEYVRMVDNLPAQLNFVGLSAVDSHGFSGNVACLTLPTPGANDAAVDCTAYSLAPGETVTYTLAVQVANCVGAGLTVENSVDITSYTADNNASNNHASWPFTTSEDGTCNTLLCDASGCISNACKINDHCENGTCVAADLNCDDQSVCTADSCDPAWQDSATDHSACINDSSQLGDLCFDGNDCTFDTCDPVAFCVFPPKAAGTACNDFLNCTLSDACDGNGGCIGLSVCDDGQPCTDDFADEANNCACDNPISFPGSLCNDGNACTLGTTCDGTGGSVAACNNATGALNCDDNNPCTDDSCDPASGCVHTNNAAPCSDGNACTEGDTCGNGTCNAGAPVVCNDGNGCTDDSCDAATGCVYTNNTAPCSDNNACTDGDVCGGGTCHSGSPVNCDDNNCCTIDSCDPATGCVYTANPTVPVFTTQPSFGDTIIWSPNHGYVDFTVASTGAAASSSCGIASIQFAACGSSQPENATGTGDGNSTRDCVYEASGLHVRAERDGACSPIGRVYTTQLIAVDVCGHTAISNSATLPVWHDRAHPPVIGSVRFSTGNTNDYRSGTNGTYGTDCGAGIPPANGTNNDHSDADPEMEISQQAAVNVNDLRLGKSGASVQLTWAAPVQIGQVTRFHIWRLDPVTLFWTQIAEVSKQTTSYLDPSISGPSWQYKVSAVIK